MITVTKASVYCTPHSLDIDINKHRFKLNTAWSKKLKRTKRREGH